MACLVGHNCWFNFMTNSLIPHNDIFGWNNEFEELKMKLNRRWIAILCSLERITISTCYRVFYEIVKLCKMTFMPFAKFKNYIAWSHLIINNFFSSYLLHFLSFFIIFFKLLKQFFWQISIVWKYITSSFWRFTVKKSDFDIISHDFKLFV